MGTPTSYYSRWTDSTARVEHERKSQRMLPVSSAEVMCGSGKSLNQLMAEF